MLSQIFLLQEGELPEDVDWVVTLKIEADGSVQRVCGVANQVYNKNLYLQRWYAC